MTGCEVQIGEGGWGKKKKETPPAPAPVKVAVVQNGRISTFFRFHSVLRPEKEVFVYSRTIGLVTGRFAEEGDRVVEGQLLVKLDDTEQKLALARAETNFNHQDSETNHAEELFKQGMLPDDDIRRIRLALRDAEFNLEQAKLALEYTSIRAPFSGIVTNRAVDVGDRADVSRPIYTIVDRSKLYADGWLSEAELSSISHGEMASVRSQGDTTITGSAEIIRISNVIDPTFGKVKVAFLMREGASEFKPGQFVELQLTLVTHDQATVIPKRSIIFESSQPNVFLYHDSLVFRRSIKIGISEGDRIEVLDGLSLNDTIIVEGHTTLRDSAKVRIQLTDG